MPGSRSLLLGGVAALAVLAPLSACAKNEKGSSDGAIAVVSTAKDCTLSTDEVPSGNLVFDVENQGSQVTEFYLLADDGLRIIGEVENIGPGITRKLVVQASEGTYITACKPGMVGDGIRGDFTVSKGEAIAVSADIQTLLDTATDQYAAYVKDQTEQLLTQTQAFAAAYIANRDDEARELYPQARTHSERIEPVAESFGDLDPRLDLREADLEEGETWTGWHRIEKDLWPQKAKGYTAATAAERKELADQLVADTQELYDRTRTITFTADQLGNGAKELLDEVATGKVTGEEEIWSGTDLWDFQANLDGARIAFENLRPVLEKKDPDLIEVLDSRFTDLQKGLDRYKKGDGFVTYGELTPAQIKTLADEVNALGEPLSKLTAAVVL